MNFNGWLNAMGIDGTGEAMNRDGICCAFTGEDNAYWGKAFELLRDANFLLENLPKYQSSYAEITYNHYLGEAIMCVPQFSMPWPVVLEVSLW